MNMLITAGGTAESIDSVRVIANTATGRLGSMVADCFAASDKEGRIFYVCGKGACRPRTPRAEITEIGDTGELEAAVRGIIASYRVDGIIHSMAVSDYRLGRVCALDMIAASLADSLSGPGEPAQMEKDALQARLTRALEKIPSLDKKVKISSDEKGLVLFLEPAPKIISLFQDIAPHALLVGFKLLDHAPYEVLIEAGFRVLEKNRCAFVLANDLSEISPPGHIGYLIRRDKGVQRFEGKRNIAEGIVAAVGAAFSAGSAR